MAVNVDEAEGRDLEVGDDGKAHEGHEHERLDVRGDTKSLACLADRLVLGSDDFRLLLGHDAAKRQGEFREDVTPVDDNEAPAHLLHVIDREGDILLSHADRDHVMGIVGTRRGDRPAFEADAVDEADPDVAG